MELHAVQSHLLVVYRGDEVVGRLRAHSEPLADLLHAVPVCEQYWLQLF